MATKATKKNNDSSANLGFEAKLWLTADKLRNNMDAAEYKHVVLGLIFLKYISDTFEEHRAKLLGARDLVRDQFSVDFAATAAPSDLASVQRAFQKRHLLAHKMGVIDQGYLSATTESPSLLGRRVSIASSEVRALVAHLQMLGVELFRELETKQ